jgi:NitT/TauT family transport system substrate-binding protein
MMRNNFSRRALLRRGALGAALTGLTALGCRSRSSGQASAPASAGTSAAAAGPPVTINTSWVGTPYDVPLFLAVDSGLFQKAGLDVKLTQIAGPTSVAALLSSRLQFDHAGSGEIVGAGVQGGEVAILATLSAVYNLKFYGRPNIKTVADLKGKKVGITNPNGEFDMALRASLPMFGVQPDKDVTFIATGSIANVVAALLTGAIDGAAIAVGPDSQKVEEAGMPQLFDYADLNLPYSGAAVAVQRSYLSSHRDLIQRYIDALIVANIRYKHDKAESLKELTKIYQDSDPAGLELAYTYYTQDKVMPPLPYPKPEQFKSALDALCKKTQPACNFDVSTILDSSFVESAAARGLGK